MSKLSNPSLACARGQLNGQLPYPFGVSMNLRTLPSYNHFTPFCRTCTVEALFRPSTQTPCGPPKSKTLIGRAITRKPQAYPFTLSFRLNLHEIWHTNEATAEQVPLASCTYLLYAVGLVLYYSKGIDCVTRVLERQFTAASNIIVSFPILKVYKITEQSLHLV